MSKVDLDAASTLTSSTEDMSISSEGAKVDINIDISKSAKRTDMNRPPVPEEPFGFRRCSLEHAKQYTEAKSPAADASKTTTYPPPRRRSSLKSGPSSATKHVAFSKKVHMKKIGFRDDAYFQATWLSRSERAEVQEKAKTDMGIVKHLNRNPELASRPDMRYLRSLISVRGMEHFYTRHTLNLLKNEKESVICAVLEAQQRLGNSSSSSFTSLDSDMRSSSDIGKTIANASAYHSLPSRRRALRLAEGDEAAVRKYLSRGRQKKTSSQDFCARNEDSIMRESRRASMPSYKRTASSFKLATNEDTSGDDSVFFVYP